MNASRIFLTTAVALSALAAIGCSSTRTIQEPAQAPVVMVVSPEPVAVAEPMPMPMPMPAMVQAEPRPEVFVSTAPPITVASADITERAPQADRN